MWPGTLQSTGRALPGSLDPGGRAESCSGGGETEIRSQETCQGCQGGVEDLTLLLNVGVFSVVSGHKGVALRLCYLHLGASGWDLRGPSPISGHHNHLQSQ